MLTGESRPCARGPNEAVMAGSHNVSATVQVRLQQVGEHTRYAQLVELIEQAALSKPRIAQLAVPLGEVDGFGIECHRRISSPWSAR